MPAEYQGNILTSSDQADIIAGLRRAQTSSSSSGTGPSGTVPSSSETVPSMLFLAQYTAAAIRPLEERLERLERETFSSRLGRGGSYLRGMAAAAYPTSLFRQKKSRRSRRSRRSRKTARKAR